MAESAVGRVDAGGRLLTADARLLTLQERAGGRLGDILAVPPLASLSRIARSLDMLISRSVVVAEGDRDLDLWVRARPDGDTVVLTVGGWRPRPPRVPWLIPHTDDDAAVGSDQDGDGWTWATDATLRLTALSLENADVLGQPLTRIVRLIEDDAGDLPIIAAIAAGGGFEGQRAVRRDLPDSEITLSATAFHDDKGRFAGFKGRAHGPQPDAGLYDVGFDNHVDSSFAEQLEQALRAPFVADRGKRRYDWCAGRWPAAS